jgi:hypothetical protein
MDDSTDTDDSTEPDLLVGSYEDYRLPADPDEWDRAIVLQTGRPCPECDVAIGVVFAPPERIDDYVDEMMEEYDGPSTGWSQPYDVPCYAYCDRPTCEWDDGFEWSEVRPVLEVWMDGDAKTWRETVMETLS